MVFHGRPVPEPKCRSSLAIVGAGAVGMEFADVYAAFGSNVTVIEALDRVLPLEDEECSAAHHAFSYKKRGHQRPYQRARLEAFGGDGLPACKLTVKDGNGDTQVLEFDAGAVRGRPGPQYRGCRLWTCRGSEGQQTAGSFRGGRTTCGPTSKVCTPSAIVPARPYWRTRASHEGIVCVEYIAGVRTRHTVDYSNIPNCTYTHPEVASIGLTEAQAREQGHDIEVGKFPWVGNGRALAGGHADGFIKVIRDKKYSEILGAHIIGPSATELIAEYVIGRHLEATVEEIDKAMHPHPTLSEAVAEGALSSLGRAIHI